MMPLKVHVWDDDFFRLIPAETQLSRVVTGYDFLEGPIWDHEAQKLTFSDILGNSLYSWTAEAGVQQIRRHSYMANGNAYDHQGRLITCEHATSRVTRSVPGTDKYEVLASHYQEKALNSPNDVVVKRDGTIYFTDPTSGRSAGYGVPREPELTFSGVYRLNPESGALRLLVDDFATASTSVYSLRVNVPGHAPLG